MKILKSIIIGAALAAFFTPSEAGPPPNAKKLMIPFPVICTPTMTEMMGALTEDYAVHISMIVEETPENGIVVVMNPNTNTAAVLHVRADRTCLVFSGLNLRLAERPEGMAARRTQVQEGFEES